MRRFGAVHSVVLTSFFLILLWPVGPVKKYCFGNWFARHGDQTAAEDPSEKCVVRGHRKVGHGGRLTFS